jgi:hypothetical protein
MFEVAPVGTRDLGLAGAPVIDVFARRKRAARMILAKIVPRRGFHAAILHRLIILRIRIEENQLIRSDLSEMPIKMKVTPQPLAWACPLVLRRKICRFSQQARWTTF